MAHWQVLVCHNRPGHLLWIQTLRVVGSFHHRRGGGYEGAALESYQGFAEEQQEGVTGFHRLEGAAKIPNTGKAPLEVCKNTSRVCKEGGK